MVAFKIPRPGGPPAVTPDGKPARAPRRRVLIDGMFHGFDGARRVAIRNVSRTGAAVQCAGPLKVGTEGVLKADGLDSLARIIWSRGTLHGIKFDEPLPNHVVLTLHGITRDDVSEAKAAAVKAWYDRHAR